jgi:hypothetical protein
LFMALSLPIRRRRRRNVDSPRARWINANKYSPDGDRYVQRTESTSDASINRTIYYVDKVYERVDWSWPGPRDN